MISGKIPKSFNYFLLHLKHFMPTLDIMQIACHRAGRKRGGKVLFPGISSDAKALDVTLSHLWRVLVGQRQSKSLLSRYNALQEKRCGLPPGQSDSAKNSILAIAKKGENEFETVRQSRSQHIEVSPLPATPMLKSKLP
jgi:hypothetical protein